MRTLYLVRHAKSSWDFPELADADRPLAKRGLADAPRMARRLAHHGVSPQWIVTSPAVRAATTATLFLEAWSVSIENIHRENALYHADPQTLLRIIRHLPGEAESAMVFGHNPGLTDVANRLCSVHLENIPTCGVAAITFGTKAWIEASWGAGTLAFFFYPKQELKE